MTLNIQNNQPRIEIGGVQPNARNAVPELEARSSRALGRASADSCVTWEEARSREQEISGEESVIHIDIAHECFQFRLRMDLSHLELRLACREARVGLLVQITRKHSRQKFPRPWPFRLFHFPEVKFSSYPGRTEAAQPARPLLVVLAPLHQRV